MRSPSSFRPFDAFRPLRLSPAGPRFSIGALFANSELGGYYPIRPEYLFEDSAGTTPAAVDGVVGLQFDQAQKAALGPELVAVPYTDYWNSINGLTTYSDSIIAANASNVFIDSPSIGAVEGRTHRVTFSVSGYSQGRIEFRFDGPFNNAIIVVSNGEFSFDSVYTGSQGLRIRANTSPPLTATISGISVREIKGNHAWQATTANKPYLRQTPETQKYWLDGNTETAALNVTFTESLGANCTVARVRPDGVEWLESQTIGTTYNLITPYAYNSDTLIIDRALTLSEKAQVERLMLRSVPRLGDELVVNGTFDSDVSGWSAVRSAVLTWAAGKLSVINGDIGWGGAYQAVPASAAGKMYFVKAEKTAGQSATNVAHINKTTPTSYHIANLSEPSIERGVAVCFTSIGGIMLNVGNVTPGHYAEWDNASMREIQ